jgi:hypothetical protein
MVLMTLASKAIGKRLRRVIVAVVESAAHRQPDVPPVYYRFPPF